MKLRINKIDYSDRLHPWMELAGNVNGSFLRLDLDDPDSVLYDYLLDIIFKNGPSDVEVEFDSDDFMFAQQFVYNGTMRLVGLDLNAERLRIMMRYEERK